MSAYNNYYKISEDSKKEFLKQLPASPGRNKILCSLLAAENISIVYRDVKTASFNTITRVLEIPKWDDMSLSVIDRLIIHEVGHALYTKDWPILMAPLSRTENRASNIVEDRRVDNAMRKTYPGVAKDYSAAAKEIFAKNIWDIQNIQINKLGFFDRANMLSKVGHVKEIINFSAQEKIWLKEIENTKSTHEAVALALRILAELKEKKEEEKKQEKPEEQEEKKETPEQAKNTNDEQDPEESEDDLESGETDEEESNDSSQGETDEEESNDSSQGENDESEDKSNNPGQGEIDDEEEEETESENEINSQGDDSGLDDNQYSKEDEDIISSEIFDDIQTSLDKLSKSVTINHYVDKPIDASKYIISLDMLKRSGGIRNPVVSHFLKDDIRSIRSDAAQLFKEFSVRKEANVHNTFLTDRGSLDMNRLSEYKTNDQIFTRSVKRISNEQNHKFYFLIDYSGSMVGANIQFACRQVAVFREFCLMAKAEYEVYLFTTGSSSLLESVFYPENGVPRIDGMGSYKEYYITSNPLLMEIANNAQSDKEFYNILNQTVKSNLGSFHMAGTPSTPAVKVIRTLIEKEKLNFPDKKINFIMLTDGEEGNVLGRNCIFEGPDKVHYSTAGNPYLAQLMMMKKNCHSILGFTINSYSTIFDGVKSCANPKDLSWRELKRIYQNELNRNSYVRLPIDGFDDFYVIKNLGEDSLEDALSQVEADASAKKFSATFIKSQKGSMVQKAITKKISEKIS